MSEALAGVLLVTGGAFLLLAGLGVLRMPDLFARMQASTKASTLGVGCVVIAAAIYFGDFAIATRLLLVVAFLFLTAPVSAHVIGRSAYFVGVPLWEGTVIDELHGRYDRQTHVLHGAPEVQEIAPGRRPDERADSDSGDSPADDPDNDSARAVAH